MYTDCDAHVAEENLCGRRCSSSGSSTGSSIRGLAAAGAGVVESLQMSLAGCCLFCLAVARGCVRGRRGTVRLAAVIDGNRHIVFRNAKTAQELA